MTFDPELESLAKSSRQKLVDEFTEKYANLRERMRRIPIDDANKIAERYSCPLQVAIMAYLMEMDGIISARKSISLMAQELSRRFAVGEEVPNLPGNVQEFVLIEGRWIGHIYGSFSRDLELKIRSLSNLEVALNNEDLTVEMALSIFDARNKLALGYIYPIFETWLHDHPKANSEDVLMAFGPAITKWNPNTLRGKLNFLKRKNLAFFRRLKVLLQNAEDSATVDYTINRISMLIKELEEPFSRMNLSALAHFVVHIIPRTVGRGDMSRASVVISPSTRGFKAEPDMNSPFDFLERDIRLARRRYEAERERYLKDRVGRVLRVLLHQEKTLEQATRISISEIIDRLKVEGVTIEETMSLYGQAISEESPIETFEDTVSFIVDFVFKHVYGG